MKIATDIEKVLNPLFLAHPVSRVQSAVLRIFILYKSTRKREWIVRNPSEILSFHSNDQFQLYQINSHCLKCLLNFQWANHHLFC